MMFCFNAIDIEFILSDKELILYGNTKICIILIKCYTQSFKNNDE